MDFKDIGINRRNWVDLAQDRDNCIVLVNVSLNLRISYVIKLVNRVPSTDLADQTAS